jgi:hypothetical protein
MLATSRQRGGHVTELATYAITLWQPMAWAVIYGNKDIENRSRRINPCNLLIHAGLYFDESAVDMVLELTGRKRLPELATKGGFIIGQVTVIDATFGIHDTDSPWAIGNRWHWHLRRKRRADPPIICRGYPGLWRPPKNWEKSFTRNQPQRRKP